MSEKLKPPPTIQTCRVLEYSKPDADITATQRCFSGDKEVGPIVWLAICQNMKTAEIVLFFCDCDWTSLGSETFESILQAKSSAESTYPGISASWIKSKVNEQEALKHLDETWNGQRCIFCGKTPLEVPRLLEKNGLWICEICVETCYGLLKKNDQIPR